MTDKKVVHLSDPEEVHWVDTYLMYRDKMNHYKTLMDEAKEEWLSVAGDDWDILEVNGNPVFENVKTTPYRFSVAELKRVYPEIYDELVKQVPQTSIKVL